MWTREGFVARTGHDVGTLSEWVLELTSRNEAKNVCTVVHHRCPYFFRCVSHFLQWGGKQKHRLSEQRNFRFDFADGFAGSINVRLHAFFIPGIGGKVEVSQSHSTHSSMRNVAAISGGNGRDIITGFCKGFERTDIGDRS